MGTRGVVLRYAGSFALSVALTAIGCGGGSSSGERKPDTGYGAGETPPATINCADLCTRLATCAADLCDEDTMSMNYGALSCLLVAPCESSCTDELLQMKITIAEWQCLFESSCRQAVDASYDACNTMSSYSCS
jgi:hypothetical protein